MAKRRQHNPEARLSAAWKAIWETPAGKLAISEMLVAANVYSEIITNDPVQLALAVGERNMAARIARWVGMKNETYVADALDAVDRVERFVEHEERY